MQKLKLAIIQFVLDFSMAASAWSLFYIFRKIYIEPEKFGHSIPLHFGDKFWMGLILIPIFWAFLYSVTGTYKNILRRSRLKELGQTLLISLIGIIVIFFALILDDEIVNYKTYYESFFAICVIHFSLTYVPRLIISSVVASKIHSRNIGFNTILIGNGPKALETFNEIEGQSKSSGNRFVGYVTLNGEKPSERILNKSIPKLGNFKEVASIIESEKVEEAIISLESNEHNELGKIINALDNTNVIIKVTPEQSDILTGSVKMSSIFGVPLIEIKKEIMPTWQQYSKRILDISVSLFVLICLFPLFLILSIIIKATSKGPIIFSQERIGKHGKPFNIYKFRSMYIDAEFNGPALSSKDDSRITNIGKVLRKYRFDELPNFYNVLIGDMSLVGPRPERQHFIDLITQKAPHYTHLHKVKSGITSWGQVKYGYAENVDQMIERLKYDLLYIENMSLFVDFKIMIYTVLIVLKGRGK